MDILWLIFAFGCGFAVKQTGLPPLIGFLIAGFALNLVGVEPNDTLQALSDLGITLMLFVIGLKLNVSDLAKREIWAGAFGHMGLWMAIACALGLTGAAVGLGALAGLEWRTVALIAFALGFSSTVCVIKVLEDSGEVKTRHGRLAVGILIMQDVIAVLFLAIATGKVPSPWAVLLLGLFAFRLVLHFVLGRAGHGEMLPLTGFMMALGGYELFSALGVKGDIGALIFGVLLSSHVKSAELAKSLLHFKDLFLIGFFLSIGLTALPTLDMIATAVLLCLLLPLKLLLFFGLLTQLGLRARTAYLASLVLSGYSEFGLIVVVLCVQNEWLTADWLVITALAVALSFVLTSVAYRPAHSVYARYKHLLRRFEKAERLPEDQVYRPREAEILVVGTGRVGRGAFNALHKMAGDRVWGMDASRELIDRQRAEGLHVFVGDAENADVWELIDVASIRLVLLAVASVDDNRNIANQLRRAGYAGPIAAIARYDDEGPALLAAGVDKVFNFFTEAGAGFAEDSLRLMDHVPLCEAPAS
ncbi:MAG: cation:proton antiporter family protein [Pseudomonadota bacterium]